MARYPTAYKKGSHGYPGKGSGLSKLPTPANDPVPLAPDIPWAKIESALKKASPGIARKVLPRLVPGLGAVLVAKDIYDWWQHGSFPAGRSSYWQLQYECNHGLPTMMTIASFGGCHSHQQSKSDPLVPADYAVDTSVSDIFYEDHPSVPDAWVVTRLRYLTRSSSDPGESVGMPLPNPRPYTNPATAPVPGTWPKAFPRPNPVIPGTAFPPRPGEQPSAKPEAPPKGKPNPRPGGKPATVFPVPSVPFPLVLVPPRVVPRPGSAPVPTMPPVTVISTPTNPGSRPVVRTVPATRSPPRKPPPKNVFESKPQQKFTAAFHLARAGVNFVTESLDFVDVLWGDIPKPHQTKAPRGRDADGNPFKVGYADKMRDIYEYAKHLHANGQSEEWHDYVAGSLANWVNNAIEDNLYGKLGQTTGKATKNLGVSTGLSRATTKGQKEVGKVGEEGETQVELPQLVYDPETNEWSVTTGSVGATLGVDNPQMKWR